ncbi:MAG: c-type cytochrome biogenesis protein CcmF, partial [Gammaproteobacteria bacterium]
MIPDIGHFALILALGMALLQAILPIAGAARGITSWTAVARPAARGQFVFLTIAIICLWYSFIVNDFS